MSAGIASLRVRWTGAARDDDDRRPAAVARRLAEEALPRALQSLDTGAAVVCLGRLDAGTLELDDRMGEHAMADALARHLAAALRRALGASGPDVVRWPSPRAALDDMVASLARGDRTRAWAWRQAGLAPGPAGDEGDALERALRAEPEAIVPLAAAAARRGEIGALLRALGPTRLARLAVAAWGGAGAPEAIAAAAAGGGAHGARARGLDAGEVVPAGPAAPGRDAPAAVAGAVAGTSAIWGAAGSAAAAPGRRTALALLAVAEARPALRATSSGLEAARVLASGTAPAPGPPGRAAAPSRAAVGEPDRAAPDPPGAAAPPAGPGRRAAGRTGLAGLLFLLPLVPETGLLERLVDDAALAAAGGAAVLHALGRAVVAAAWPQAPPPAPDDPGLLALSGIGPSDPPPVAAHGTAEAVSRAAEDAATQLGRLLAERIREPVPAAALARTVRRAGTVLADPGWLEVHLDLGEVDVAVRRAGLDLDPGHVPWLGVVVRFVYA